MVSDKLESGHEPVGLILAAGYSSRMGSFKPLLPIGDLTAIERVTVALKQAGVHRIIGVTGFQRDRLNSIFASEGVIEAYNPDFEQGMFTSIKTGIRMAVSGRASDTGFGAVSSETPDGFFLMLVDCPLIPSWVLKLIMQKHAEEPEAFIVPCYRGKKGHPLFIPARYADEILAYEGDGGLKAITSRYEDRLIRLEVGTEAVVLDMDTQSGYEEVLEYYEGQAAGAEGPDEEAETGQTGRADGGYSELLRGKRLFLIRHGETRPHREKIFLGQTDVPLSEKGREQAVEAAEELKRYGISAHCIYTSDLSRAVETAEIIRDSLMLYRQKNSRGEEVSKPAVIRESRLREISLGEWDGRFISEIREQFPEAYQKRGDNLLTYKFGNDCENFYDLQYRVMKGLRNILRKEREPENDGKDIVIVSHSGVINVIVSNLQRKELTDEVANHTPNGGVILVDYSGAEE